MKKIFMLLLLTACFSRSSLMTRETFDGIDLGTSAADVRNEAGDPYAVHFLAGDREEYEYVERVNIGGRMLMEHHYYLTISGGEVVAKRTSTETPPAYNIMYEADPNYPHQN